jgi:ubiquinone/menaquinone biosynthesis C-methylase UbiE
MVRHELTLITLDPPYRLGDDETVFRFRGWAEVDDPSAPDMELRVNGLAVPIKTKDAPKVADHFPGVKACYLYAEVDFASLFAEGFTPSEPFLLVAEVRSGHRRRSFEYAVTPGWLEKVFGRRLRPRATPPEDLQIRVTGAAAGAFHATGALVARQIADLLQAAGQPLTKATRILDFGCGPGRVIGAVADLHPSATYAGCDIDAEAIAWCQAQMRDVATFKVNGHAPPLPFPDQAFDLIYSISIFTHLPEDMQHQWLDELRRVLKPGGVLLTTKLNPAGYDLPEPVKAAGESHGFAYWGEADATDGLPDFYRLAYHTHDYVRRVWGHYFDVLRIGQHDLNNTQDSVILQRRTFDPLYSLKRFLNRPGPSLRTASAQVTEDPS